MFLNYDTFCPLGVKWVKTVLLNNHMLRLFSKQIAQKFLWFYMLFYDVHTSKYNIFSFLWCMNPNVHLWNFASHPWYFCTQVLLTLFCQSQKVCRMCAAFTNFWRNNTERLFYKIQKELFCYKKVCKHKNDLCIWNRFAPQQKPFHPTIFKTLISCSFLWPPYSNVKQSRRYLLQYFGAKYQ